MNTDSAQMSFAFLSGTKDEAISVKSADQPVTCDYCDKKTEENMSLIDETMCGDCHDQIFGWKE